MPTADFYENQKPTLPWFRGEGEEMMVYFAWPLEAHVHLIDVPIIKCCVYFDGNQLVQADYRLNPSYSLSAQFQHALVVAEHILSEVCKIQQWQTSLDILYSKLQAYPVSDEVKSNFSKAQHELYQAVTEFINKQRAEEDENEGEGDDDVVE